MNIMLSITRQYKIPAQQFVATIVVGLYTLKISPVCVLARQQPESQQLQVNSSLTHTSPVKEATGLLERWVWMWMIEIILV